MSDLIRIGDLILSGNSCSFKIDAFPYNGILALDYEQKRERKIVYGSRRDGRPLGRTAGKYSVPNFSMTMLRDSYDILTTYLTAKGLGSYGDAEFSFIAQYIEPGLTPITVIASQCTIDGEKEGYAEGIEELVTEVQIGCLEITKNGKSLFSRIRALP